MGSRRAPARTDCDPKPAPHKEVALGQEGLVLGGTRFSRHGACEAQRRCNGEGAPSRLTAGPGLRAEDTGKRQERWSWPCCHSGTLAPPHSSGSLHGFKDQGHARRWEHAFYRFWNLSVSLG